MRGESGAAQGLLTFRRHEPILERFSGSHSRCLAVSPESSLYFRVGTAIFLPRTAETQAHGTPPTVIHSCLQRTLRDWGFLTARNRYLSLARRQRGVPTIKSLKHRLREKLPATPFGVAGLNAPFRCLTQFIPVRHETCDPICTERGRLPCKLLLASRTGLPF